MAMMPSPGRPPKLPVPAPGPSPGPGPEALRLWSEPGPGSASAASSAAALEAVLEEFTRRWDRGESPRAEDFLDRLPAGDPDAPLELIYHEFCLHASSGRRPLPDEFVLRFPHHRDRLLRLIALHDALPSVGPDPGAGPPLPEPGDRIGPFRLIRELGRGGLARVYLAADAELEDRLLVVKVTDRPSAEHRYLARAPHPHIVPILRERTTEDGLQLIFMPFVGGATLGDVLAESRMRPRRPDRGADLLADLDLRSAPEYAAAAPARPARELVGSLSYPQAVAWIVARLAEALDHAFRRGVTHGDLKPSNVLIGGDGQPMLLDFNLSTDWRPASPSTTSGDPGGTLAYMAPERLRAVAEPELAAPPCPASRHRADLYALGLILREALTGAPPHVPSPDEFPRSGRALAALLAAERTAGDPSSRRLLASIPPGLRVILRRCLAPDPADRYPLASHLAADLDRWRTGLPLAHATPPRWVEVRRWARYHRRPLLAAALCVSLGVICTGAAARVQEDRIGLLQQIDAKEDALGRADRETYLWFTSSPDAGSQGLHKFSSAAMTPRDPRIDFAERLLGAYGLLEGESWDLHRIARLPEPDRSDARAMILEQALYYGIELSRPAYSPFAEDRRRALAVIDRILQHDPIDQLEATAVTLRAQLDGLMQAPSRPPATTPPRWLTSYLEGVRAEVLRPDEAEAISLGRESIGFSAAIAHYKAALLDRPDLFWPRYRLAAVSFEIGDFEAAGEAYRRCLEIHPRAAIPALSLGSCQYYLGDSGRAIENYRRALRIAPRWQAGWSAMATLAARLDRGDLLEESVAHVRLGTPRGGGEPWRALRLDLALISAGATAMLTGITADDLPTLLDREANNNLAEIGVRTSVARGLLAEGRLDAAIDQCSLVLDDEPSHLYSRFCRAIALQQLGRKEEAIEDYRIVAADPNFDEFVRQEPTALMTLILLSADEFRRGRTADALRLADDASLHADRLGSYQGEAHYALARAFAAGASTDPTFLTKAADALAQAKVVHPGFIERRFFTDPAFDAPRAELADLLGGIEL